MLFKDIIGQETIKQRLVQTIVENRISHAQLFLGPEGCGKLGLAIAYAQFLSCESREENDSCGTCPSCLKYNKLIHPDLHFVYPVSTTKTITKDPISSDFIHDWRSAVLDNPYLNLPRWYEIIGIENKQGTINRRESYEIIRILNLKTFESDYKVMIIWMPEKMNHVAANKLLKIIEEPPPNTLFLLVSETTDKLLPTILSRTQIVKIPRIDQKSIADVLNKNSELGPDGRDNIVRLANGNYFIAQNLMTEREDNDFNFTLFTSMRRLSYGGKIPEIINWVDQLAGLGREKQKQYLLYAMRLIRENFMINVMAGRKEQISYLTHEEEEFSKNFAPFIHNDNVSLIVDELNKSHSHISSNANSRIVMLDLCLKIMKLIKK